MKKYLFILYILLGFTACKTKQPVAYKSNHLLVKKAKEIIANYEAHSFHKKSISAKLKTKFKNDKYSASVTVKLRMELDKTIWLSVSKLGIPVAKMVITPHKVRYYEKINKTYFEGSVASLTKYIGTKLDFKEIQNVFLGQAVINLKRGKYISKIVENQYQLIPKKNKKFYLLMFWLNPDNFKLNSQEIRNLGKDQNLALSYAGYRIIDNEVFPKTIELKGNDFGKKLLITMNYHQVEFNKKLQFPFKIPKGYKKIKLP